MAPLVNDIPSFALTAAMSSVMTSSTSCLCSFPAWPTLEQSFAVPTSMYVEIQMSFSNMAADSFKFQLERMFANMK